MLQATNAKKESPLRGWIVSTLLLLILLAACTRAPGPVSSRGGRGDITVEIWASIPCALPGETVTARATVTNEGSRPFIVESRDQPVLDLIMESRDEVHRWSDGKPLTLDVTRLELNPGQSKTIEMKWVVQPATGSLGVYARLIYDARQPSDPIRPSLVLPGAFCPGVFGP